MASEVRVRSRFQAVAGYALAVAAVAAMILTPFEPRTGPGHQENRGAGPDSPDQAMEWILLAHRDEQGNIPRNGLMRAREQMDAMRREAAARLAQNIADGRTNAAGLIRGQWNWIGPTNIGGRVRALVVLPHAPSVLVTGGVAGGIWKSTDAGATWRLIDDFMGNLAVSTIVFKPDQPSRLFAGTGEGFFNADSIRGAGVFVSNDEGESWSQQASTANVDFDFVNRLAFSSDGSVLIAATRTGLFRSTDAGGSWTQVLAQTSMMDVKFIAGSSSLAVASGRNRNAYYSVDGGATWTISSGLNGTQLFRVELAVSVSSPNIVFASVEENSGQVWRSVDSGVSYVKVSDSAHLASQGWYDNAIWIDPTNPNLIVAGGVSLFRSTNGGTVFSAISSCHVDQHLILHDPGYNGTTNRRVYFTSDGGVCKMEDVTATAVTSLRNGLGITQFYGGGGNSAAGRIMGGTQDNGTLRYTTSAGNAVWSVQHGSDGGFASVDHTNPNIMYGEIQNFRLHRTLTGTSPSQYIYGGTGAQSCTKPPPFQITDSCSGFGNFIAPFLLDPNDANRLLAGGRSLWRSLDPRTANTTLTGPSWGVIKPPTAGTSNISAIAIAPGNSELTWVGHNNGDVYVSFNAASATPTWTKVDGALPNRVITSIAVDPFDTRIVYVALGGFSPDALWRTTNAGATWVDVTGSGATGLPDVPVRSVAIHPQIPSWIYAGTDVGVFASEDGGANWNVPHDGPANVAVFQLFWLDNTLVAVTHGRGMFTFTSSQDFPVFARRPLSQGVLAGSSVVFTALALGLQPMSFQWFRGASGDTSDPISGATSTTYTTPPITTVQSFWVRASNSFGTANSPTATLTLLPWGALHPGVITQGATLIAGQPGNQAAQTGASIRFTVRAHRSDAAYQWQVSTNGGRSWRDVTDSGLYGGSRSSALYVWPVNRSLNGVRYRCVVTAGSQRQVSGEATLSVRR